MNKNDCESLGYILSKYQVSQPACDAIYELDERIENEHKGFLEVQDVSLEIDELTENLMNQYNRHLYGLHCSHWSLIPKEKLIKTYVKCLKEAKRKICRNNHER